MEENTVSTQPPTPPGLFVTTHQTSMGPGRRNIPYSIQILDAANLCFPYHQRPPSVQLPDGSAWEQARHAAAHAYAEIEHGHHESPTVSIFNLSGLAHLHGRPEAARDVAGLRPMRQATSGLAAAGDRAARVGRRA
ncbi:hypothetical protein FB107DRAFT_252335 [Schizophyllum commune]